MSSMSLKRKSFRGFNVLGPRARLTSPYTNQSTNNSFVKKETKDKNLRNKTNESVEFGISENLLHRRIFDVVLRYPSHSSLINQQHNKESQYHCEQILTVQKITDE